MGGNIDKKCPKADAHYAGKNYSSKIKTTHRKSNPLPRVYQGNQARPNPTLLERKPS
jgi:hypothetical protein